MTRRAFLGALALVLAPAVPAAAVAGKPHGPHGRLSFIPAGFSGGFYSGFAETGR